MNQDTLAARIQKDFVAAMKEGGVRLETVRLLRAALQNRALEKRAKIGAAELTEDETQEVVMKEIKKRREAIELYTTGGRPELAAKEKGELEVLEVYLPPQMSEEEVRASVAAIVAKLNVTDPKEFGKVMGVIMKELKGKADSAVITRCVKEVLGS